MKNFYDIFGPSASKKKEDERIEKAELKFQSEIDKGLSRYFPGDSIN